MSQKIDENNPRASVTVQQKALALKIKELSPDDPVGVTSDDTGKPPAPPPPPPPSP